MGIIKKKTTNTKISTYAHNVNGTGIFRQDRFPKTDPET